MILNETNNLPIATPQINDMPGALNRFRDFKGNDTLQMSHLITFLQTISPDRDAFFKTFNNQPVVISARYIIQILS